MTHVRIVRNEKWHVTEVFCCFITWNHLFLLRKEELFFSKINSATSILHLILLPLPMEHDPSVILLYLLNIHWLSGLPNIRAWMIFMVEKKNNKNNETPTCQDHSPLTSLYPFPHWIYKLSSAHGLYLLTSLLHLLFTTRLICFPEGSISLSILFPCLNILNSLLQSAG